MPDNVICQMTFTPSIGRSDREKKGEHRLNYFSNFYLQVRYRSLLKSYHSKSGKLDSAV